MDIIHLGFWVLIIGIIYSVIFRDLKIFLKSESYKQAVKEILEYWSKNDITEPDPEYGTSIFDYIYWLLKNFKRLYKNEIGFKEYFITGFEW